MDSKIENLQSLRIKIDNIDEEILKLIDLRSELAKRIIGAKSGTNIFKPKREEVLIKNLIKKSKRSSPEYIESLWRLLISENLKLQGGLKIVVDNSNETLNTTNWYFGYGASITSTKSGVEAIQKLSFLYHLLQPLSLYKEHQVLELNQNTSCYLLGWLKIHQTLLVL